MRSVRQRVSSSGQVILAFCLLLASALPASAQVAAGYSEYFIPGDEQSMFTIFNILDVAPAPPASTMHCLISVTAWSENTTIYFDHWEDGYDFDPANPDATADEKYTLAASGGLQTFESGFIPIPNVAAGTCSPAGTCLYDGGDRIYVAGGAVTITRASWIEARGVGNQAAAWEIFPIKPQLTTYVMPFGENIGFSDFNLVFVLIQATADNTTFTVDYNGDGTPDNLNQNRNTVKTDPGDIATVTLQRGQTFLLDRISACTSGVTCTTAPGNLNSGTVIQGSSTLQVKYIAGNPGQTYRARGFSAFPRGFWTKDYYAPLDNPTGGRNTDYYLYNPNAAAITVEWQSRTGGGSFPIGAGATVSFRTATGGAVPANSGLYFKGSDIFWGVGVGDALNNQFEWGFSLLPSTMLYTEHFLGWAPDSNPGGAGPWAGATDMGVFLTVAQDNTRVFVDFNNDNVPDQTYTLDRLQTQYIVDPDGFLSQTHFWATGPFTLAYGQDADTARTPGPPGGMDLGYVAIPGTDFISLVLTVDKSVSPQVVPTAIGSVATFTIKVNSQKYTVDGVNVTDYLPPNWNYVIGTDTTTITKPDKNTVSGGGADPTKSGAGPYTLSWSSAQLGTNGTPGMAENQEVTITFTARTTAVLAEGTLSQNRVKAVGTRTFGTPSQTQTFTTTDFVYVVSGLLQIAKTSTATNPLYPGDTYTYTTTVTNPATATTTLTGVSLLDPLPAGVSYVANSGIIRNASYGDQFNALPVAYTDADGLFTWAGAWTETEGNGAGTARMQITGGVLQLQGDNSAVSQIARAADLSSALAGTVRLSFDSQTSTGTGTDNVTIDVSNNGVAWTNLGTITGTTAQTRRTYAVPDAFRTATARIRFSLNPRRMFDQAGEFVRIDNLFLIFDRAAGNPPDLVPSSFGVRLPPVSATPFTGERLIVDIQVSVDNPLATGISSITNTAATTSAQLPITITASVTNLVDNPSALSGSVGGRVWFDADGGADQDLGETGFDNVEVTLKDRFGTPVATTVTDTNGRYLFIGVARGAGYYVEITDRRPTGVTKSYPVSSVGDQTVSFDLTNAAPDYAGADLGYKPNPGTVILGDQVWIDANINGARDAGEVGLGGVTLSLFLDVNGDGFLTGADGAAIATTTSAPDGSYLFTGVAAVGNPTYFVSAATPSGYLATVGTVNRFLSVIGGSAYLTGDYGFRGDGVTVNTYTIKDRVWMDTNTDGIYDSGTESGFPGVTIELLDSSLNVIGTTTTGADGTFIFSGVAGGGADYTVRINDTAGILVDYYGTTSDAQALKRAQNNVSAIVDNTTASPYGSFGFFISRSIGDTVFNDWNGIAGQQTGENGIAGVTVRLYNDNGTTPGAFDAGDTLARSVVTDLNGQYLFSGLINGTYWVNIDNSQAALSAYDVLTTADDSALAGHQRGATLAGTASNVGIDYGYRASTSASLSGTVWNDLNADGSTGGESGLGSITIDLLSGGVAIRSTTTAADGTYSFAGLPNGSYTVKITDTSSVLSGYGPTYEPLPIGLIGPFDGQAPVTLSGSNVGGVNFGFKKPKPTYAAIASFTAYVADGSVTVEWHTSLEVGTVGFHLLRRDPVTKRYAQVNDTLLPGLLVSPQGGTYRYQDEGAPLQGQLTYKLVEVEVRGNRKEYGPYSVSLSGKAAASTTSLPGARKARKFFERQAASMTAGQQAKGSAAVAERRNISAAKKQVSGSLLKIATSEAGLHYLAADQIAGPLGVSAAVAAKQIAKGNVTLTNRGRAIPSLQAVGRAGIYFLAEPVESMYTDENVYWLGLQRGETLQTRAAATQGLSTSSFQETLHREEDRYPLPVYFQDPEGDFWCWDYVFAGFPGLDAKSFTVAVPGVAAGKQASLTVHLQGGSDTEAAVDHHVFVSWNGVVVGEASWDAITPHELVIVLNPGELLEGGNTLGLKAVVDPGVAYSIVYLDSIDLTYERRYEAVDNELTFAAPAGAFVTVTGFSMPGVLLLDTTTPSAPVLVKGGTMATAANGTYRIQFATAAKTGDRHYLAVATGRAKTPVTVVAAAGSTLRSTSNSADYVLIAPDSLAAAAGTLAAYRSGQGLETLVVNLEEVYDTFNDGIASPLAIREFLRFATGSWQKPPRYATLVGRGTFDYKNRQGVGDNLVPPLLAGTPYGLIVSDTRLADLAGDDGIPEIALGRLPVQTTQELLDYIEKVQTHESAAAATWQRRVLMVADNPDDAGQFTTDSDEVAALVPADYQVSKAYLTTLSAAAGRQAILDAVNAGVLLFNYIGHGGLNRLADENLFASADVASLTNAGRLPVFLAMTCSVGNFAIPGYPSLAETLLLRPGAGAYAVWAPSGLSENKDAVLMDKAFCQGFFTGGENVIGEVMLGALRDVDVTGSGSYRRQLFNLLGEPVSRLP